ncbi:MAG TPA: hypothetical protein VGM03_12585 [Phycisphaerae bacterium]|jgi:chromosome segregation ATPase
MYTHQIRRTISLAVLGVLVGVPAALAQRTEIQRLQRMLDQAQAELQLLQVRADSLDGQIDQMDQNIADWTLLYRQTGNPDYLNRVRQGQQIVAEWEAQLGKLEVQIKNLEIYIQDLKAKIERLQRQVPKPPGGGRT